MLPPMNPPTPFRLPTPSYRGLERRSRPRGISLHDRAELVGLELRELPWTDWATWEAIADGARQLDALTLDAVWVRADVV